MTKQTDGEAGLSASISDAYEKVSDKVATAYAAAREGAATAAHGTASRLEGNPLVAVAGGLALGAIAAALIPRSDRERELLAPVGARIAEMGKAALDAARTAGLDALEEAGISQDNARTQASRLFEQAVKAAGAAGTAAVGAARDASSR